MSSGIQDDGLAGILNALGGTPAPSTQQSSSTKTRPKKQAGKETKVRFPDARDTSGEEINEVAQQVVPPATRLTKNATTDPVEEEEDEADVEIVGGKGGVLKRIGATPSPNTSSAAAATAATYVVMTTPCQECQAAHEECRTTR